MTKHSDLILEILCEEIPSRMQLAASEQLQSRFLKKLQDSGLVWSHAESFITPRRMTLHVKDIPVLQEDRMEEKRGPRVGAPDAAIQGFLTSAGLSSLDACEQRVTDKGDFWFAMKSIKGEQTRDVLPEIINAVISDFSWPKSMRWGHNALAWVRPLRSILCLFGGELVPGLLDLGHERREYKATTVGHRFLSPQEIQPKNFEQYQEQLRQNFVMVNHIERRQYIQKEVEALAQKHQLRLRLDEGLMDEITGLVEWPVCFLGRIDEAFMDLPEDVLMTSMRVHQRYCALEDKSGRLAPYFILAANIIPKDGGAELIKGNERVLRARLSDAKFFYDQDRLKRLENHANGLPNVIFQEDLGSMAAKVERIQSLSLMLAETLSLDKNDCLRAALLCKADLMSQMVGEFPELQGIMGGYYALHQKENLAVAQAITDHYRPKGFADDLPSSSIGKVIALADKLDTLVGYFAIGIKPTGSKDPYALRRSAIGCIRLMESLGGLPLDKLVRSAYQAYDNVFAGITKKVTTLEVLVEEMQLFFQERMKAYWKEKGIRHDYLDAVFAVAQNDSFEVLAQRIHALHQFLSRTDGLGDKLLSAYRRANNMVRQEEKKDGVSYVGDILSEHFEEESETRLHQQLQITQKNIELEMQRHDFQNVMESLALLGPYIDSFFDKIVVNAPVESIRKNRLHLLSEIAKTIEQVADFSKIEG
ncbi:MAG: glycine--tRNA ligase subunit beta [Alphaproteobacteria bacterium]|nr:glycine--tRNA ligase subunit beta [Alphaproteobacteria bacterium]